MTQYDVPAGANETGCGLEPTGLWVRARADHPGPHQDGLRLELEPLDPSREGRLSACLCGDFIRCLEDATGVVLRPDDLAGEHTLLLSLTVDPLQGLSARIVGVDRGPLLKAWTEQDAATREAMDRDRLWDRQRNLPVPSQLRRVILVEPDDGAPHPLGETLGRWYELGMVEVMRHPIAFEEPGSVAALHEVFGAAWDQYEWGTLDAVLVEPGTGFAHRALSDEALMRRIAVLPLPVIMHRAGPPTLLDSLACRSFDTPEEIVACLTGILLQELKGAGRSRLAAIARELDPEPASGHGHVVHGPLFD